ncbi:TIGR03960 family B12-binding radical SAM protein [Selenomonas sp. TAMA-11512]|uniref:TIGR03960 family B12-binding radical SAM protein n=1 Tax=Selenomonas sp. TAMA-11512 TaxID=3095337 RepID=UPI00308AA87D|nr:TIGR03960 family B12-binding radical SAM protein [Selenomonas sp. TAMA-11512]
MNIDIPHSVLQQVEKPMRYTGGEWNSVVKDGGAVKVRFALAMADVYEVGMSNLGLKILYEILNGHDDIAAERVYAPWLDMEERMRERRIPLYSLETKTAIKQFDLLGFSLQYELLHTTMLNMLDLAGIPIRAGDRTEADPFVLGGGPCVYNPEPAADFFDFFVLGDGEEVTVEVSEALIAWKDAGYPGGRRGYLERVAAIDGVYVPSLYEVKYHGDGTLQSVVPLHANARSRVYRRAIADMDAAPFPEKPVVPYLGVVHDRIMLELFRGCTRGCRFCQAGMAYRPVRERRPEHLREMAKKLIDSTGYNEMSLTSLSSADYSCLDGLVTNLMRDAAEKKVSFSLPSLRIDSFSIELAHKMQQVRKSGLTFAPEAGTQRLRDVINKGVTEEDLLRSVKAAFRYGWKQVKLYFMMGLPTETDDDIRGIAELTKKVVDAFTEVKGRRGVKVTVSVSCFVPKPYTPFQWFGQIPQAEFERRQRLLKESITDRSITFNYHDARASVLEGALSRGDRRLSDVIYTAWKKGAKFDGWSDQFKQEVWQEAFADCGIDPAFYSERTRGDEESFPWEHTSPGVSRAFLLRERKKAYAESLTVDCRRSACSACGVCPSLGVHVTDHIEDAERVNDAKSAREEAERESVPKQDGAPHVTYKYRAEITKGRELRYLSHLDYAELFIRAIRRANLPAAYSEGFNPHLKINFGSALAVGTMSRAEYMDFELTKPLVQPEVFERLRSCLPLGAELLRLRPFTGKAEALMAACDEARYAITAAYAGTQAEFDEVLRRYRRAGNVVFHRVTPKKTRDIRVKDFLISLAGEVRDGSLLLKLAIRNLPEGSMKAGEVLQLLVEDFSLAVDISEADIERTALLGKGRPLIELV